MKAPIRTLFMATAAFSSLAFATPDLARQTETNPVVFRPLDRVIQNNIIKKRDRLGNLCYYDTARRNEKDYYGPIGGLTYQVTKQGIYTYPDIGDYFGSRNGGNPCEMNHAKRFTETEFEAITVFDGWDGMVGCALTGCRYNDLNGYYVDDYYDYDRRKYRAVANQFNPLSQVAIQKTQGLGKTEGIDHPNRSEYLWFSYPKAVHQRIDFAGVWLETRYNDTQQPRYRCLLITPSQRLIASSSSGQCPTQAKLYSPDSNHSYGDMWWLGDNQSASLAQLNALVKWYPAANQAEFTLWEYLPVEQDWQQATLYRFKQRIDHDDPTNAITTEISELKKVARLNEVSHVTR